MDTVGVEVLLRICAMVFLVTTACLIGFDTQTKLIFRGYSRKVTFKDLDALHVLVFIDSGAAAYNLLQLVRNFISSSHKADRRISYKNLAWFCFILDQVAVYVVFTANSAAFTASALAITGVKSLQWMKWCHKFTRFCFQVGSALLCGYAATFFMAIVSSLSAFSVLRLYSPKHFLVLKGTYIVIPSPNV